MDGASQAPVFSNAQVINQINSGQSWSSSTITYSFLLAPSAWDIGYEGDGFSAFTDYQQAASRNAISLWDDLIAPSLVEDTVNRATADVNFGNTTTFINYAHAYYPGNFEWAGQIWLNSETYPQLYSPDPGDYFFLTVLHEIGHALGLSHPGNYNGGSPTYANDAEYAQDTHQWTLMSYFSASNTGADWNGGSGWEYAETPMVHDILTIQAIYGADTTTRSGETTYGFNSTAGNAIYDFSSNSSPVLTIYDAGGIDTLDLSGFAQRAIINLAPGTYSSAGGTTSSMTYNIGIAHNTIIENAFGGAGNDTIQGNNVGNILRGNGGDDRFYGYGGNDSFFGGSGSDTVFFSFSFDYYTFNSFQNNVTVTGEGVDTVYSDIEWLVFSDQSIAFADLGGVVPSADETQKIGTNATDILTGTTQSDTITGLAGDDAIDGNTGIDTAVYQGVRSDYAIVQTSAGQLIVSDRISTRDGKDNVINVEQLQFSDGTFSLQQAMAEPVDADGSAYEIYRFFNKENGAHFFTSSVQERDTVLQNLPQFSYEGNAFDSNASASSGAAAVYRFFNSDNGVHFYTASAGEADYIRNNYSNFNEEGIAYYAHTDPSGGGMALYRFLNTDTGSHFYTTSLAERDNVINTLSSTFNYEGIAYYVDVA